ncbi:MAG TPA: hypothetical protein VE999_06090 [Gemmataceae bacterium]|nr:hypothetical protein [Gemmataceae bacterium]
MGQSPMAIKLGDVTQINEGWGFLLTNEQSSPAVSLVFADLGDAESAHAALQKLTASTITMMLGSSADGDEPSGRKGPLPSVSLLQIPKLPKKFTLRIKIR